MGLWHMLTPFFRKCYILCRDMFLNISWIHTPGRGAIAENYLLASVGGNVVWSIQWPKTSPRLSFHLQPTNQKAYHLDQTPVRRSIFSDGNELRPAIIFEKTYQELLPGVYAEMAKQQRVNPEIKIIDSTAIDLCSHRYPLANFREKKGGINLHTVLVDMLPHFIILTDGKKHDLAAGKDMQFASGDLLMR
jgi:hypothetical protein